MALGFQQNHYGLFLVAAGSGTAFWLVQGSTKLQQMRYYPRMGDIEVAAYDLYHANSAHGPVSSPLIDWSWYTSWARIRGGILKGDTQVPTRWDDVSDKPGKHPFFFAHVAFPHLISVLLGAPLFCLGLAGLFGPMATASKCRQVCAEGNPLTGRREGRRSAQALVAM
jgi:hypothetical protein